MEFSGHMRGNRPGERKQTRKEIRETRINIHANSSSDYFIVNLLVLISDVEPAHHAGN